MRRITLILCLCLMGCVTMPEKSNCPRNIRIEGYKVFFGKDEADFVDIGWITTTTGSIYGVEGLIVETKLVDSSYIYKYECTEECIYLWKEHSTWKLCDYYYPNEMVLRRIN